MPDSARRAPIPPCKVPDSAQGCPMRRVPGEHPSAEVPDSAQIGVPSRGCGRSPGRPEEEGAVKTSKLRRDWHLPKGPSAGPDWKVLDSAIFAPLGPGGCPSARACQASGPALPRTSCIHCRLGAARPSRDAQTLARSLRWPPAHVPDRRCRALTQNPAPLSRYCAACSRVTYRRGFYSMYRYACHNLRE